MLKCSKIAVAWEMRKSVSSSMPIEKCPSGSPSKGKLLLVADDGWHIVASRKRRGQQHRCQGQTESISSNTYVSRKS